MKRFLSHISITLLILIAVLVSPVLAEIITTPAQFNAEARFDGGIFIVGVEMTATAAQLNNVAGTTPTFTDVTLSDITPSGGVGDSLGYNYSKAASVTGLFATVKNDVAGDAIDTDFLTDIKIQMDNDSSESIDWVYWYYIIDDNTTNTEDSAAELYLQVGGTATKVLDVNVDGLIIAGDLAATTIGGITEADLLDKTAAETITGVYTFTPAVTNTGNIFANGNIVGDGGTILQQIEDIFVDDLIVTNEATIDGVFAITGPDATTGLMVQGWTNTLSGGTHTHTFDTAFGATPVAVVVQYAADPGAGTNKIFTAQGSWSTTQAIITGDTDVEYTAFAIGARP